MAGTQGSDERIKAMLSSEELTKILVNLAKRGLKNPESRQVFVDTLMSLELTTEQILGCLWLIDDENEGIETPHVEDEIPPGEPKICWVCRKPLPRDKQGWEKPCPGCAGIDPL